MVKNRDIPELKEMSVKAVYNFQKHFLPKYQNILRELLLLRVNIGLKITLHNNLT